MTLSEGERAATIGRRSGEGSDRRLVRASDGVGQPATGSLAAKAMAIETRTVASPWADHEYGRGYAVLMLPYSSGHQLGLRVFPENVFGPYVSVWHRPPDGEWSIYVDGPSLETTCPRYWGPAIEQAGLTDIAVAWTGSSDLHVEVADPELDWTMSISTPRAVRRLNGVNAALPDWTWRVGPLLRLREWMARRVFDLGDIRLSFRAASGHEAVLLAKENYAIRESTAVLDGNDLGEPVRLDENPTVGDVALPAAPSFLFGRAYMRITDHEEFQRTRDRVRDEASDQEVRDEASDQEVRDEASDQEVRDDAVDGSAP